MVRFGTRPPPTFAAWRLTALLDRRAALHQLVACTWSGKLHVIKNSERRVHFRVMFPAATMFTSGCGLFILSVACRRLTRPYYLPPAAEMTSDDACIDPVVVVVDTSGAIFVFADIDDTISRALDPTPLVLAVHTTTTEAAAV